MASEKQSSGESGRSTAQSAVSRARSEPDRAQTTIDFTLGVTIFVVVVTAVFIFVPGALQPFTQGGQENIVTVNRVADDLAEQALVEEGTPHILNGTCTAAFFDSGDNRCGFDGPIQSNTGVRDFRNVNVTIQGNVTVQDSGVDRPGKTKVLCYDESADPGDRLEDPGCGGTQRLAIGDPAVETGSSVTSRRVVELDGKDVFLVVRVW